MANAPRAFTYALSAGHDDATEFRRRLRTWLADTGLDEPTGFEITLACWEAVANALEHPLTPSSPIVDVKAHVHKNELTVTVRDYGGWREHRLRNNGGLGYPLMRSIMNTIDIDHRPEGTWITLRAHLAAGTTTNG